VYIDGLLDHWSILELVVLLVIFLLVYWPMLMILSFTANATRLMLSKCVEYANAFNIVFNACKSKCFLVKCNQRRQFESARIQCFITMVNPLKYIEQYFHLGHIISADINDKMIFYNKRNAMVIQIKTVLCYFRKLRQFCKVEAFESLLF